LGWNIGLLSITRKTQKGLPQYDGLPKYYDAEESDVFILSGAEDLVPVIDQDENRYVDETSNPDFIIFRYRSCIESLLARIEKWVDKENRKTQLRSVPKENFTTECSQSFQNQVFDSNANHEVFSWLIEK
jgi:hypothetical protein